MNSRIPATIVSIFLLGFSFSNVSAEQVIRLESAYRQALGRSESIAIAREDLLQSEDEIVRMKSFLYPKVTVNLDYLQRPAALKNGRFTLRSKSTIDWSLILSQSLYNGGRTKSVYRSAKLGKAGETLQLALTTEDLLFEIAVAHYRTLKAENSVEIGEKEVERLTEHLRSAVKRLGVCRT